MVLLCDVGQVEARFGPFRDSVNLNARWVHGLCRMCNRLGNHFGRTQWNNYVTWVKWMLVLVHLVVVLMSVKIGERFAPNVPWAWKSLWAHKLELLGDVSQVEACFGLFGHCVNLDTRYVHGLRRAYHRLGNHLGHTR